MIHNIEFLIQQVQDNCKWYFGHSVQVVTTYDHSKEIWHAIVYPSECTLASVSGYEIHLHVGTSRSLYGAANELLQEIQRRIAKCFRFGSEDEVPVVQECEATCNCLSRTASTTTAEHGSEVRDVETALGIMESDSACGSDQHTISDALDITTGSCSPSPLTSAGQDSSRVQKIESTQEDIEHRTQRCSVETSTAGDDSRARQSSAPVQSEESVIMSIGDPLLTTQPVGSIGLAKAIQLETEYTVPELFLGHHASGEPHSVEGVTPETVGATNPAATGRVGAPRANLDEADGHTRGIVREEIGRVLAGAMDCLAGPVWRVGNGGT